MRTARLLPVSSSMYCSRGGVPTWGCTCPGGGGVPDSGVPAWGCTCPGGGGTCPGTSPHPREQNSWHTLLKIIPCPKLRLWAVNIIRLVHPPLGLALPWKFWIRHCTPYQDDHCSRDLQSLPFKDKLKYSSRLASLILAAKFSKKCEKSHLKCLSSLPN